MSMNYPQDPATPAPSDETTAPQDAVTQDAVTQAAGIPPAPPASGGPRRGRRGRRQIAFGVLIVLGLACVGGGGFLLARELGRKATKAEVAAAVQQEVASRWQRLPAGKVFPATVSYTDSENITTTARLVGIATPASCQGALDPSVERAVRRLGCTVVLRATYVDASGTLVTTIGVAVLRSAGAAGDADVRLTGGTLTTGVRAVTFGGTLASGFGDQQRLVFGIEHGTGPYLFFYTGGYADGRPDKSPNLNGDLLALGDSVATTVESVLTSYKNPCSMKDIKC
jgi:hypothetical protein